MRLIFIVVLSCIYFLSYAEVTRIGIGTSTELTPELLAKYPSLDPIYKNIYPPRVEKLAIEEDLGERYKTADSYANQEWNALDDVGKGAYLMKMFEALNKLHGYKYSKRIMTCIAYRESNFKPQIGNPKSTSIGLGQVTEETAKDMIDRGIFSSELYGYSGSSAEEFIPLMKRDMVAQMEAMLGVMYMKNKGDVDPSDINLSVKRYRGGNDNKIKNNYASAVYNCANCIKEEFGEKANKVSMECLSHAKVE